MKKAEYKVPEIESVDFVGVETSCQSPVSSGMAVFGKYSGSMIAAGPVYIK